MKSKSLPQLRRRPNWGEKIYEDLLDRLRRGEIGAKQRLVDVALAGTLGVSRMPVRDALFRLAHEGYLTGTTRGFTITHISADDAEEIFEIRKLLEPRAASSAASHMSDETIAALEALHAQAEAMVEDGDAAGFTQTYRLFHRLWLDNVPNRRLADMIHRLAVQADFIRHRTFLDPQSQAIALAIMGQIARAFRDRDISLVHESTERLLDRGRAEYIALLRREAEEASPA